MWGFCEGSDYATVSTEAICYGVLDFFAKVVFGWIVIINLDLLATGAKDGRSAHLCPPAHTVGHESVGFKIDLRVGRHHAVMLQSTDLTLPKRLTLAAPCLLGRVLHPLSLQGQVVLSRPVGSIGALSTSPIRRPPAASILHFKPLAQLKAHGAY